MTAPVDKPRCPVDIDLINPDTFESGLPLEAFAAMREDAPVFWHDHPGTAGDGFWVITRHADVMEVSRTPELELPDEPLFASPVAQAVRVRAAVVKATAVNRVVLRIARLLVGLVRTPGVPPADRSVLGGRVSGVMSSFLLGSGGRAAGVAVRGTRARRARRVPDRGRATANSAAP